MPKQQVADKPLSLDWQSPGEVASQFLKSDAFVRGLRGPVGSGKSVTCCIEIMRRAMKQQPNKEKVRRTRWAVIRNSYPDLKNTTIKTWRDWYDDRWGKFLWSTPYTHNISVGLPDDTRVEAEVIFLALDHEDDVRKLLSMELTGVWINEAREVKKSIVDGATMRCRRFPAVRDGGATWSGVIMDTNSPDEVHWWGIMAGEVPIPEFMTEEERKFLVKPENWAFYTQPAGMNERLDQRGDVLSYEINLDAENIGNLDPRYYPEIVRGKTRPWINGYILNRYQSLSDGKRVYPTFRREVHVSREPLQPLPGVEISCGIDFGRTPAAIFGQKIHSDRWLILHEFLGSDMGANRFAIALKNEIGRLGWSDSRLATDDEIEDRLKVLEKDDDAGMEREYFQDDMLFSPKYPMSFVGDPAGSGKAQTDDRTPFMIMRAHGLPVRAAPSNDPDLRIEAVEAPLNRLVDGMPGMLVSPNCTNLIAGFEGGYHFKRKQVSIEQYDDKPNKNRFSHPHDALQYLMLAGGEGTRITTGRAPGQGASVVRGRFRGFSPFRRMHERKRTGRFA
tara:strand:+ start:2589 stop:4271 length:1683 start_codon:yes stop_codon:yes gene_type:complete